MLNIPLNKPNPDFDNLVFVLKREKKPNKVSFVEVHIDFEVIQQITDKFFGIKLPEFAKIQQDKINDFNNGREVSLLSKPEERDFIKGWINFYYRIGYDYVQDIIPMWTYRSLMNSKLMQAEDTATSTGGISKGMRGWAEEGKGPIRSWKDFENFPWKRIADLKLEEYYKFIGQNLPSGMKLMSCQVFFENVYQLILGYEGLFYLLYDQPDLVKAVFNESGKIIYEYYKKVIGLDFVGGIFHADDMGFKTSTLISPQMMRELVFPWHKKFGALAHEHGKMFWFHSCGNEREIIEDLIDDINIDAYHSFEDAINPVTNFKKVFGDRIAVLGGVDMDKLCRLNEKSLRAYVKSILDQCMVNGGYALGSGNSIANYIPIDNYLIMLDEGFKWEEPSK